MHKMVMTEMIAGVYEEKAKELFEKGVSKIKFHNLTEEKAEGLEKIFNSKYIIGCLTGKFKFLS